MHRHIGKHVPLFTRKYIGLILEPRLRLLLLLLVMQQLQRLKLVRPVQLRLLSATAVSKA